MKCIICNKSIRKTDFKAYVFVYREGTPRKVHACDDCNETTFDDWIDALPMDDNGHLIDPASKWIVDIVQPHKDSAIQQE